VSSPAVRRLIAVLAAGLMTSAAVGYGTVGMSTAAEDLGELIIAALAAISCGLAWRATTGRLSLAWGALALACLGWATGQAIWSYYELVEGTETPFPSVADLGFLGFPVGAMAALAVFPSGATRAHRRRMILDGLMAATAVGLVSWTTALGAVVEAGGDSPLAVAVSIAYPVTDIALLVVCVLVLSRTRAYRWPLGLVALGLGLMAVADSGFAYLTADGSYSDGSAIDLGWFLAFGFLALAPLTRNGLRSDVPEGAQLRGGTALPYVPLAAAVGFLAWQYADGDRPGRVEVVLASLLVLLVLVRQFLTVHDNKRLTAALSASEAELRHQAFHDGLTGLANRARFVERLAQALDRHERQRHPLAICFVDLDGFKAINDSGGHAAGDRLLRLVAERFHATLSAGDTLARLGGDEFAVLLDDRADPLTAARALLASLAEPFTVDDRLVSVRASIGVAEVGGNDLTPTLDELLSRADIAMYTVKRGGKADVLLHTPGLQLEEVADVALGRSLAEALADNSVQLAFQPIVELATGRVRCLEVLVRWTPDGLGVPASVVVRVAERCHLLDALFHRVLTLACAQLASWVSLPGGADLTIAVNLSASQLSSPELPRLISSELAHHGLRGSQLVLEITETDALEERRVSFAVCEELRRQGIRLAVDDFGVGMSSMARLRDLPIDVVKIDRSFVAGVDTMVASRRFVRGVLAFAEQVDLIVVAEGVEHEAERTALAELGCPLAQGFLFSRPVPAGEVPRLILDGWRVSDPVPQ
jgi:diguanylate cyclase (GGDEF)-like protein